MSSSSKYFNFVKKIKRKRKEFRCRFSNSHKEEEEEKSSFYRIELYKNKIATTGF